MVKESDEELMKNTPITSNKLLEKPKDDKNGRNLNPIIDRRKQKSNQFHGGSEERGGQDF